MPNLIQKLPKPFTPMRRFLYDVLHPSVAIGKRLRDIDEDQENTVPGPRIEEACVSHGGRNCVALQNDDVEEDAVVITALKVVPFCCHADLLLMSRVELVRVADNLNAKLPVAMRIDTSSNRTDHFIRTSIELIVGIRRIVPQAPKANRSLSLSVSNLDFNSRSRIPSILPLSPLSPLVTRKRQATAVPEYVASAPLASLREEADDRAEGADRPQKRRRIHEDSSPDASPTPMRRYPMRSQSHRAHGLNHKCSAPERDGRMLRSRSERLPPLRLKSLHRNVTVTRGRASTRVDSAVPIMTSTPKPRRVAATKNMASSSADVIESLSVATISATADCSSAESMSARVTPRMERVEAWVARTNAAEFEEGEVTSELANMTICGSSSTSDMDMDISL